MVKLKMPQDGEERWEYPENFFKPSLKGENYKDDRGLNPNFPMNQDEYPKQ
jgi:hypothetical protein